MTTAMRPEHDGFIMKSDDILSADPELSAAQRAAEARSTLVEAAGRLRHAIDAGQVPARSAAAQLAAY
ncbi:MULTISPECIES: hypothetical protein [unclassified Amycolatopsis]|uniref:hypothetical protein n=1 Tax=unclassified Amycolatopsis TaxID=2618356 RepID=UPI003454CC4D